MKEEKYTDRVRYFYTRSPKDPVKRYVRVELPNDSSFAADEFVTVTVAGDGLQVFSRTVSDEDKKSIPTYRIIRQMDIGDELTFPYAKWASVRSIASNLKKVYGAEYSVRKPGPIKSKKDIIVTRLK